jgi:gamma-glutamyltranspeptidase/glutathione hydrolase
MPFTTRPVLMGTHGMVTAGHYLAAAAGFRMLEIGGNAIDAGVAAGLAVNVLEPQSNGIGGEAPILIYSARQEQVYAINGQGYAPKASTIDWFKSRGIDIIPGDGFLSATVPGAFGAWLTALQHFGKLSLKDVLTPAIELTAEGFPVYPELHSAIDSLADRFRDVWPSSARVYLPHNRSPAVGELFRNVDWANTFKCAIDVEIRNRRRGREAAIEAARDYFYKGEIVERIVEFTQRTKIRDASNQENYGLLAPDDFQVYQTKVETPVTLSYRGYDVYKCNTWCQGPVFLQQLALLEGYDLSSMGYNSADYIHTVVESGKLAFADREKYYGDPDFVTVPLNRLLSKAYAAERRRLISPEEASMELRPGDAPPIQLESGETHPNVYTGDTTHLDAIDCEGNMIAATPSGGWIPSSPVIEGLGFPLGTRGQMFYLDVNHANALAPHKRPRTTLTPSLVMKDGEPFMVFGTPGGDCQDQWTLQFFLNFVDVGMNLQEAIDAPNFHTRHFPSSFYPHNAEPGSVVLEGRIPESVRAELADRGHQISVAGDWSHGRVLGITFDSKTGLISAGASPRAQIAYAMGR